MYNSRSILTRIIMLVAIFSEMSVHGGSGGTEKKVTIPIAKLVKFMKLYENYLIKIKFVITH